MNKLKRVLVTLGLASALALGGQVVTADNNKAEAVTYGSPYRVNLGYNHCAVFMHYNYNWWEETFLGKRDGAVYQYRVLC